MKLSAIGKMIRIITDGGAENIHLTGGEPTLRKDFGPILSKFKNAGLGIFMDTNCDHFFENEKVISQNVQVIGLPIDFSNKSWRNEMNLKNVLKVLNFYKSKKFKPKIRVLSTVTKENIDDIVNIGELLKKYQFDVWRIFQFLPLKNSNAEKNRQELKISRRDFLLMKDKITKDFSALFNINFVPIGYRNKAYFIISSHGKVMIPTENGKCENKIVGDISDVDIVEKWSIFGSEKNFNNSTQEIFDLIK